MQQQFHQRHHRCHRHLHKHHSRPCQHLPNQCWPPLVWQDTEHDCRLVPFAGHWNVSVDCAAHLASRASHSKRPRRQSNFGKPTRVNTKHTHTHTHTQHTQTHARRHATTPQHNNSSQHSTTQHNTTQHTTTQHNTHTTHNTQHTTHNTQDTHNTHHTTHKTQVVVRVAILLSIKSHNLA
jgi:hypothetical protein